MQNLLCKFSLEGKYALVTCPERTYGVEITEGLLAAGAKVWLAGDSKRIYEVSQQIFHNTGFSVSGLIPYYPGTEEEADHLVEVARKEMIRIDILVENSAIECAKGWRQTPEQIYEQLKCTHLAMMLNVQKIGTLMAEQEEGSVLLVTDYGALVGYDANSYETLPHKKEEDFSLTLGFIRGGCVNYARQAAGYLGEHGCRCNCIAYGPTAQTSERAFEESYIRHSHLKRMLAPEDIATAAIFLSSDAAAYITGITLAVDGGYTAK